MSQLAPKPQTIPLEQLREATWNANRCSKKLLAKIRRSMEEFGFVENLVARPHPEEKDAFEVLSGNHRLRILKDFGATSAPVVVVDVDDNKARLLAQAMNRTRGRDDPEAYRRLVNELLEEMSAEQIAEYLPQEADSIATQRGFAQNLNLDRVYGVIVDCADETDQVALLETMLSEGRQCRALLT